MKHEEFGLVFLKLSTRCWKRECMCATLYLSEHSDYKKLQKCHVRLFLLKNGIKAAFTSSCYLSLFTVHSIMIYLSTFLVNPNQSSIRQTHNLNTWSRYLHFNGYSNGPVNLTLSFGSFGNPAANVLNRQVAARLANGEASTESSSGNKKSREMVWEGTRNERCTITTIVVLNSDGQRCKPC